MDITQAQRDWLTLSLVPGVGASLFIRLLARFTTPEQVLSSSEVALAEVVGPKLAERIRAWREVADVESQLRAMGEYNAGLITMDDPEYPEMLAEIYDPPLVLFHRGALYEQDRYAVAIVGTRKPTPYGITMAEKLGRELAARGITVVSGLAAGVDAAAHTGALEAGGRTIAVLGCGVDIVYPPENAQLMHRIVQQGAILSSFSMGKKPARGHFPSRNRLISGLTLGTVIVEAPPGSGALLTAKNAAEQGREVFAVPGRAGERNAMGPHALLREGAKLVETVEDILVELDLPALNRQPIATQAEIPLENDPAPDNIVPMRAVQPPAPSSSLDAQEQDILSALSPDGSYVDEIALACRISVSEALSALTMLELKGVVRQFSGKRFAPR